MLSPEELRDIKLWFGWGAVFGYPTSPHAYLREALKQANKPAFLTMPRVKRKEILQFVIAEHGRRTHKFPWESSK